MAIVPGTARFCLVLFITLVTSAELENEPQRQYNATVSLADPATLNPRNVFDLISRDYYTCGQGYRVCKTGYCAAPGDVCCTVGTCPKGWNCCGNNGHCSPVGGECCVGGYYCLPGNRCRTWNGQDICCPSSGCVGENGGGSLGKTVAAGGPETPAASPIVTAEPSSIAVEWEYYYTTVYWTFYFFFWTSYAPYTVKTVTSTPTTTSTIWSVYATNSAEATSSLHSSRESYTFSTPYSATYLKSSSAEPVSATAADTGAPSTASFSTGEDGAGSPSSASHASAAGVTVSGIWTFTAVTLACLVGGLAFGL